MEREGEYRSKLPLSGQTNDFRAKEKSEEYGTRWYHDKDDGDGEGRGA